MVERNVCSSSLEESNVSGSDPRVENRVHEKVGNKYQGGPTLGPEVPLIGSTEGSRSKDEEVIDGSVSPPSGRFSLFKWFKRGNRDSTSSQSWDRRERRKGGNKGKFEKGRKSENETTSELSSCDSVETIHSTATVKSFAFHTGNLVNGNADDDNGVASGHFVNEESSRHEEIAAERRIGPFGIGAAKIVTNRRDPRDEVTRTLPANVLSKKRDITARYSLQSCAGSNGTFGSCGHFVGQSETGSLRRHVHVRGKRRAPNPPTNATRGIVAEETKKSRLNGRRKRRQAPKPPDFGKSRISNDSSTEELGLTTKIANSTIKEETGSASLTVKEGTGRFPVVEDTGRFPVVKETGRFPVVKESERFPVVEEPGRFPVVEEPGRFPVVEETGRFPVVKESERFPVVEETGRFPVVKETGRFPVVEERGRFPVVKETGRFPVVKETGRFPVVEETGSARLPINEDVAIARLTSKERTGSSNPSKKEENKSTNLEKVPIHPKSPNFSFKPANFNDKEATGSSDNISEARNEKKIVETSDKRISTFETFFSGHCSSTSGTKSKVIESTIDDLNSGHFGTKETKVNQRENPENSTRNFNESNQVTTPLFKAEEDISISNDSLVLQGGVLHSRRETSVPLLSGASSSFSDLETSVSRSKGRITVTTGSQTSTSAMPRPWYKRSVFEHSRDSGTTRRSGDVLRAATQPEVREDTVTLKPTTSACSSMKGRNSEKNQDGGGGTLSRLNFFNRSDNKNGDDRKRESKRKSGLSMLANISELDKEAAAIVQEEQARTRAASMLLRAASGSSKDEATGSDDNEKEVVQEIVNSAMESSPRRGTRALISKFNAIGNITKVTVNTSFFAKNSRESPIEKHEARDANTNESDWRDRVKFSKIDNQRVDKDLSRYFMPIQKVTEVNKKIDLCDESSKLRGSKNSNDITARLSFFQGHDKKVDTGSRDNEMATKIAPVKVNDGSDKVSHENSPKFTRLRVNVGNSQFFKSSGEQKTNVGEQCNGDVENVGKEREIVQKEFSTIFNEIDGKSSMEKPEKIMRTEILSTSGQVSKVLDILVEASKNERRKTTTRLDDEYLENFGKMEKSRNSLSDVMRKPMTTDLSEMLKEMKHSLPKRPKPKKSADQSICERNEEKRADDDKSEAIKLKDKRKDFFAPNETNQSESRLLNAVTVVCPPPIRIGPSLCEKSEKAILRINEEGDYERQKVSSAAQTSGNVRIVGRQVDQYLGQSSKCHGDDVACRNSEKSSAPIATSGLTKNMFQLIRPREFAQIEAIKTMKISNTENTYANVMEQSIYANANVPVSMRMKFPEISRTKNNSSMENNFNERGREIHEAQGGKMVDHQNMNTLAVNRLLRKLEAAIASGHHQQAAGLAKELARLKIHCSVVRQRTKAKDAVNVNLYIEDKLAHQGPIPLRLARSMTVAQLKAKVFTEFEIPTNVQRWIVGKNLADNDSTKLEELQADEGSPVFLYLVAPESKNDEASLHGEKVPSTEEIQKNVNPESIEEMTKLIKIEETDEQPAESEIIKDEEDEECISEEVRMERYEALISLENCDVIPNSETIECPICFGTYGHHEGVILRDCLHMFCRACIANTIRYCDEAEVKCPFRDTEYTCESTLQEREIKALVEPEIYQQHLAKSIAQAENNAGNNAFHCKTPDCPGWCIYDENVNNFLCPVCGVNNCLTCQVVHTGKNCRQYQEELRMSKETDQESKRTAAMLEEMVDRGEALPCPTCAVVLMKKWGCDWLRCSMCKTEICWVTRGPRWGPGGKGDTSGGCRCGEKGVKCHPRCNYCH